MFYLEIHMDKLDIDDTRTNFSNITFSKYQLSKVKAELNKCLYNCKIENSIYWSAELICSGHYLELWDIIILYYVKHIHISNPRLAIYLSMRFNNFKSIIENGYRDNILSMRNNPRIRKLFAEIMCILCFSHKRQPIEIHKINRQQDFDLTKLTEKLTAPNINYIKNIYRDDDPKEMFIPFNELIYAVESTHYIDIYYWIEWILEYDFRIKKQKIKCECESREYAPTNDRHDIVWIIWDIIFYYCKNIRLIHKNYSDIYINKQEIIKEKIINSLLELFTIHYNSAVKRRRKLILYLCFNILYENIDNTSSIIDDKIKANINKILCNLNVIYKQIKQNEVSSNTEYLFKDVKQKNLEKTISKLEKLESITPTIQSDGIVDDEIN